MFVSCKVLCWRHTVSVLSLTRFFVLRVLRSARGLKSGIPFPHGRVDLKVVLQERENIVGVR